MLADPPGERGYADPYGVGAFILRDALAHGGEQIPELALDGFDEVTALEVVRAGAAEQAAPPDA